MTCARCAGLGVLGLEESVCFDCDGTGKQRTRRMPLLRTGGLFASRVYCITEWIDLGDGRIEAIAKYDVSEDFAAIYEQWKAGGQ